MARRKKNSGNAGNRQQAGPLARGPAAGRPAGGNQRTRAVSAAPVSFGMFSQNTGPSFKGGGKSLVITHREYLQAISGSDPFAIAMTLPVNPGQANTFPWLHEIARKFETYTFRALRFEYVPSCATSTAGSVCITVDYDAADVAPTSVAELMSSQGAVRGPAWQPLTFNCDTVNLAMGGLRRFTRGGTVPVGKDVKTYDCGNCFVAVDGHADNNVRGDVYVEYVVELFIPQPRSEQDYLDEAVKLSAYAGIAPNKANPFGTALPADKEGNLPVVAQNAVLKFLEVGEYLLDIYLEGTGLNNAVSTMTGDGLLARAKPVLADAAATSARTTIQTNVTEPGGTLTLTYPAATTLTGFYSGISKFPWSLIV